MKTLTAVVAAALSLNVLATDYYVNPDPALASDDYDGTAAVWAGGESKVGPKRTLQGAMAIKLKSGDVVHAAEGVYNEGSEMNAGSNRVYVAVEGVGIVADGRRDRTIIEGVVSEHPDSVQGCGPDSVRCVKMSSRASYIRGFTLRNGSTRFDSTAGSSADSHRGGIMHGGTAIDCEMTGGHAGYRSGGAYSANCIGCYLHDNLSKDGYGHNGGNYYNCVIADYVYGASTFLNCTGVGNGRLRGTDGNNYNANCYNCYIENPDNQVSNTCCRLGWLRPEKVVHVDCQELSLEKAKLDPVTFAPLKGSPLIEAGSNELYEANYVAAFKAAFGHLDFLKGPRVTGRKIDIGAVEYDWKDEIGGILDAKGFLTVTALSNAVYAAGESSAVFPVGTGMTADWACPSGEVQAETYAFTAVATGSAVLTVWRDGSATPLWTLSADGGEQTFSYKAKDHSLRFEVSGADGNVTLSSFVTSAHRAFYVDEQNGDDLNDGTTLAKARATLAGAMAIPGLTSNDVVYVAPGVYSNGLMQVDKGTDNYRIIVPANFEVASIYGPELTVIEGGGTCGESDAVRCGRLGSRAVLRGFTIRNGCTPENGVAGGVSSSGALVDCIITNNTAANHSGGVYGGWLIRCRLQDNYSYTNGTGYSVRGASGLVSCFAKGERGACYMDGPVVNCTFDDASCRGVYVGKAHMFNCLMTYRDGGNELLYRCMLGSSSLFNANSQALDGTVLGLGNTSVMRAMYDATTLRPVAGARPIDFGDVNHYLTNFPSAYVRFRDTDYAGGQRIYNGKIDCGAGEFDWRGDFSQRLGRGVELSQMSADVTTNAVGKVALTDGCRLVATWTVTKEGQATVAAAVEGDGSMTVKMDGETLSEQEGRYAKYVYPGEHVCEISFAGEGRAVIGSFRNMTGLVLIFR